VGSALRDALVVAEVALAFVLLVGAGLLLRTFLNLQRTNPGLNAENVLTVHVVLSGARESMAIEERVSQIPGVRAAGMISLLPLQDSGWNAGFTITGSGHEGNRNCAYVTPGYFRADGNPLRRAVGYPCAMSRRSAGHLVNEAWRACISQPDPVGRKTDSRHDRRRGRRRPSVNVKRFGQTRDLLRGGAELRADRRLVDPGGQSRWAAATAGGRNPRGDPRRESGPGIVSSIHHGG
jgi:hypothetical protein